MGSKSPELLAIGRASLDLFSQDVGAPFEDITGFHAFVGGTPLNIAVAAQRLGMSAGLLTGTSTDGVGRLVRGFLEREGVSTAYMFPKHGRNTNAFLLSIEPPHRFEDIAYQTNSADLWLDIDDVRAAPIPSARAILATGMGTLSRTNHSATLAAAEIARANGVTVYLDVDYKAHQWADMRQFGVLVRTLLRLTDVALGTEEEICAAAGLDDPEAAARALLALVNEAVILKRGMRGARVFTTGGAVYDAPVYAVDVLNAFGAGDAFAAGVIVRRTRGDDWPQALHVAAANGALIVTRHGCANDMPTADEVGAFLAERA